MISVGNSKAKVLSGVNTMPAGVGITASQRIENHTPSTDFTGGAETNVGSFIDVTGGEKNYAVWAKNGVIRGPQIFSDKINLVNVSRSGFDLDFSKGNVIMFNNVYSANLGINLPDERTVSRSLGYGFNGMPSDFGMILYISVMGGGRFALNNIYDNNHNPTNIEMANGDFIMLLATKVTGTFEYRLLTLSN